MYSLFYLRKINFIKCFPNVKFLSVRIDKSKLLKNTTLMKITKYKSYKCLIFVFGFLLYFLVDSDTQKKSNTQEFDFRKAYYETIFLQR